MDNRDLQSQLDKASQESEIKPFTIQDLISFAEREGIKCENCKHYTTIIQDEGYCMTPMISTCSNHFCKEFEPKNK
jgi:hypothetical protein